MVEILSLIMHHDEQAVLAAVELALESGMPSKLHILNLLGRLTEVAPPAPANTPRHLTQSAASLTQAMVSMTSAASGASTSNSTAATAKFTGHRYDVCGMTQEFNVVELESASAASHDTGLAASGVTAHLHGIAVDEAQMLHEFSQDAFDTPRILLAAKHLGMQAKALLQDPERYEKAPLPAIAQLKDGAAYFVAGKFGYITNCSVRALRV